MIVIIAEKPSLAKNIADAIDPKMKRNNGYFENSEYIVTFAFGHLFRLYDIEQYSGLTGEEKVKWSLDNLPYYPEEFKFGLQKDSSFFRQTIVISRKSGTRSVPGKYPPP